MKLEPYLFFNGRAEEAIEFYKSALGAKVNMLMRMKDSPQQPAGGIQPGAENKIMHANLSIGGANLLVSDGRCQGATNFEGVALSFTASSDAECEKLFTALAEGGKIAMPLGKTFFASSFGMVTDRFGVPWMVLHHLS
jgi:PhnB protein